jgi:hypothetical protein
MMNYNTLIGSSILDSYDKMINSSAQPQMLGGKRARKFVLSSSTNYDYPGSLSVGQGDRPNVASGGSFNSDFARKRRIGFKGGERHEEIEDESESESDENEVMEGGLNFGKTLKSVGKALKPVAKVVKPIAKDVLHEYIKSSMSQPAGGRRKKSVFSSIGKELGKVGKEVFHEVIVPAGKEALKEKLTKKEAGSLLRNAPAQFQSQSYPKALASYKAKGAVTGGARSARGKIVSEVMKKHGLGLGAASAFVKAHNLY